MYIFRNTKFTLIRRIFKRDNYKISNKDTIETTTKIANIYRLTLNNNNILIIYFRDFC